MRSLFIILLSLFSLWGFSQEDPGTPSRTKADFYFTVDANGKIIGDDSGAALSIIQIEDTASYDLILPQDTAAVFC